MSDNKARLSLAMIRNGEGRATPAKMLTYVRDLTEEEINSLNEANRILEELTASSPYKHFQDRYNDFFDKLNEQNYKSANGKLVQHELCSVFGKLDDLLSSLKGFEDRTKSLISIRFGKDSTQMMEFKMALSYEFDNVFEYRFCYNLRNYSQHKGSQVGEIKSSAKLVNNQPVSSLEIILNSQSLLSKYSKWHSRVKQDLENISSDFPLIPIIQGLKFSCFRVYSKYLLSQETDIKKAMDDIQVIVGDYEPLKEGPNIMRIDDQFSKEGGEISLTPIRTNLIETIKPLIEGANHFASIK